VATLDRLAPPSSSSFARRAAWSPRRAIAAVLTVAAAIAVLQVFQTSSFANTGQAMQNLEAQKVDATAQVHQLESEIAALSSLDRIERNARDRLGMVPARDITYIQVAVPAPGNPLLPRPILPAPKPTPEHSKSLVQRLIRAVPF
jgi:cell division protein FtsL